MIHPTHIPGYLDDERTIEDIEQTTYSVTTIVGAVYAAWWMLISASLGVVVGLNVIPAILVGAVLYAITVSYVIDRCIEESQPFPFPYEHIMRLENLYHLEDYYADLADNYEPYWQ